MAEIILAKSVRSGSPLDLFEHTQSVLSAVDYLFGSEDSPTRLGKAWLNFFQLNEGCFPPFLLNLRLAAVYHDLGKANDGFQKAVRRRGDQVIRHEHLSGLFLHRCFTEDSSSSKRGVDFDIVSGAVVSHHLKASHEELGRPLIEGDYTLRYLLSAPEVISCLNLGADLLEKEPILPGDQIFKREDLEDSREQFRRRAKKFDRSLDRKSQRHRLLVAVKAALVSVDAVASAIVRENLLLEEWLHNCFSADPFSPEWLEENIVQSRVKEIEGRKDVRFSWHQFQLAAGQLGPRVFLMSACGTGKTLAAWKWIQGQLRSRPVTRVIFLYPTRATATEGFRDYVSWAGPDFAALQHGTSEFDLEGMFDNPGDPRSGGDYNVRERLFALGYWPKRIFSATVDSFLSFMRNQYASLCMLPVLCDSVVVIDEIHSFDRSMFTSLERFLEFFDIPVLCMTATLSRDRMSILQSECHLDIFPPEAQGFKDLEELSSLPRYQLNQGKKVEIEEKVKSALEDGKKVLWVVNTVSRCQTIAREQKEKSCRWPVRCYHSRFRLKDRKYCHQQAIRSFQGSQGPLLLVTTQVCEMSLDLDADVLITESAPVSSLIQRMGRCCRETRPRTGRFGRVLVYPAERDMPYNSEDMRAGRAFLEAMTGRPQPFSQKDLSAYLEQMEVSDPFASGGYIGFLDSIMYAMSRDESFREGDDFTVDCILDSEVEDYLRLRRQNDPEASGLVLPAPKRQASEDARLGRMLFVAPSSHYDPEWGFCAKEVNCG